MYVFIEGPTCANIASKGQASPLLLQVPRDPLDEFADQDRPSNVRSRPHNIGGGDLHQRRAGLTELAERFSDNAPDLRVEAAEEDDRTTGQF